MPVKKCLKLQPLVYTLIECRITPIPQLADNIQRIHAELSSLEYKLVNRVDAQVPSMSIAQSAGGVSVEQKTITQYNFLNLNRSRGLILSDKVISLKITDYSTFEDLKGMFAEILKVLEKTLPSFNVGVERLGIRYIDVIMPVEKGESVSDYVDKKYVMGDPVAIDGLKPATQLNTFRSKVSTDSGELAYSLSEHRAANGLIRLLPPDLSEPETIALKPVPLDHWGHLNEERYVILDIDHFKTNEIPLPYSQTDVLSSLQNLYQVAKGVFEDTLTPHAKIQYQEYEQE